MTFSMPPRLTLLIIASLFVLPLVLAWLMYSGSVNIQPGSGKNLGVLVEPPMAINWTRFVTAQAVDGDSQPGQEVAESLLEHWVILHPVPTDCGKACMQQVSNLRQIHLAAGRHQQRIRLALVINEAHAKDLADSLMAIHEKFLLITDPGGHELGLLQKIGKTLDSSEKPGPGTYLIDPLGNIMMYYTAAADPNDIRLDLKRLLTWSKLDNKK